VLGPQLAHQLVLQRGAVRQDTWRVHIEPPPKRSLRPPSSSPWQQAAIARVQVWAIVAAFSHARTCSLTQMPPHADAQLDFIALQAALIHTAADLSRLATLCATASDGAQAAADSGRS